MFGNPTGPAEIRLFANRVKNEIEQEYDIRIYAAAGLGLLGNSKTFDVLVTALDDKNPKLRYESMLALAMMNDMRAIQPILMMFKNTKWMALI